MSNLTTISNQKEEVTNCDSESTIEEQISPFKLFSDCRFDSVKCDEMIEEIEMVEIKENIDGNYDEYTYSVLSTINPIKNKDFSRSISGKEVTLKNIDKSKKLLLIDLDETLVHSDFRNEYTDEYDSIIKVNFNGQNISIGIFVRPGAKNFLKKMSQYFEIGIFTAASKIYADKIINYLDPKKEYIKFFLYQESCIKINDYLYIKNLDIIKDYDLKNIIIIDNNLYSFASHLKNGILVNSFYNDKNDKQLEGIAAYLINDIYPSDDVREINENIFHFQNIYEKIENLKNKNL